MEVSQCELILESVPRGVDSAMSCVTCGIIRKRSSMSVALSVIHTLSNIVSRPLPSQVMSFTAVLTFIVCTCVFRLTEAR